MKKLTAFITVLLIINQLAGQKIAERKIKTDPFLYGNLILIQNGDKSFIISKYQTTNKEYLCFLQWTYRVYGERFPEIYKERLPDTTKFPDIFNPEKFNMPVRGISKNQAVEFCQWRSDRMNEYILIREGILKKDFNQKNEDNFNTEAYLSYQYEGMVRNDLYDVSTKGIRKVRHSDYILIPGFYIAPEGEILLCDSVLKHQTLKPQKKVISDLDWWMTNELKFSVYETGSSPFSIIRTRPGAEALSDPNKIEGFIKKHQKELAGATIGFDTAGVMFSDKDFRDFNLFRYKKEMRYYKLLTDSLSDPFLPPYPSAEEKDKLGKMSYIYIADNRDGSPICIDATAFNDPDGDEISNTGFYCAMNVPYRLYWKLKEFFLSNYSEKLYRY